MMTRRLAGLLLTSALAFTVACAGSSQAAAPKAETSKSAAAPAQEVVVEATEFSFNPAPLELQAGQPVKLTLNNTGAARHDWVVKMGTETHRVVADPGQTQSITFTPKTAGSYQFVCTEPGHEPAGMKGTLTVS